ncbi:SAF domain-containing protein [Jiangella alba]|uniref:SAF domain-containing protein n=1 Tax=Jiangella alba TaxID=561176 RepID=A0A1H5PLA7_9ACTN|nr:SAF domain-containing protein [Jiangella alba]SEF13757.1 SAF domain-containing protein [Jiangella alba]
MTQTIRPDTADDPFDQPFDAGFDPPGPPVRRYRRRPALIGLGVGLLATCGAGAAYLAQTSGDTVPVLAVTDTVHRGEVLDASRLTTARAAPDPAVRPVAASRLPDVVGQRASTDLPAGTLLTDGALTTADVPAAGQSVVGVAVTEAQLPQSDLLPGDHVRVFGTPSLGDAPPSEPPRSVAATVVGVSAVLDSGHVVVDVVVADDIAGTLVAKAATGRVAIVLDAAQGGDDR